MRTERGRLKAETHSERKARPADREAGEGRLREAGSETKREENAREAPPQTRKPRQQQTPGRRGGVCSQALPGTPGCARPGTTRLPVGPTAPAGLCWAWAGLAWKTSRWRGPLGNLN